MSGFAPLQKVTMPGTRARGSGVPPLHRPANNGPRDGAFSGN